MSLPAAYRLLHDDATAALCDWLAPDAEQERLAQAFLAALDEHPDALWREGPPRHFTASALVLDEGGERVLLTHHRKARRWLQFGGHFEPEDLDVHAAASREAREESGLGALELAPGIVALSAHQLAGSFGRCREHLDIRFAGVAPAAARHAVSAESHDVRWWPLDALPDDVGDDVPALAHAARRHLGLD